MLANSNIKARFSNRQLSVRRKPRNLTFLRVSELTFAWKYDDRNENWKT